MRCGCRANDRVCLERCYDGNVDAGMDSKYGFEYRDPRGRTTLSDHWGSAPAGHSLIWRRAAGYRPAPVGLGDARASILRRLVSVPALEASRVCDCSSVRVTARVGGADQAISQPLILDKDAAVRLGGSTCTGLSRSGLWPSRETGRRHQLASQVSRCTLTHALGGPDCDRPFHRVRRFIRRIEFGSISELQFGSELALARRQPVSADFSEPRISKRGVGIAEMRCVEDIKEVRLEAETHAFTV